MTVLTFTTNNTFFELHSITMGSDGGKKWLSFNNSWNFICGSVDMMMIYKRSGCHCLMSVSAMIKQWWVE